VLGEGLDTDTDALGDGFVAERKIPGDCTAGDELVFETSVFAEPANVDEEGSGNGSDLNTLSNRARWKWDKSAKPLKAGVVSNKVMRAAFVSLCLNCSKLRR
jgi:hypothetical protein